MVKSSKKKKLSGKDAEGAATGTESGENTAVVVDSKVKIDRAKTVQEVIKELRARTYESESDPLGTAEAELCGVQDDGEGEEQIVRVDEIDHQEVDGDVYNEKDKNGVTVRTIDSFAVYNSKGEMVNLDDLLLKPSQGEDLTVFGTLWAPLRLDKHALVRTARALPRPGDHKVVMELINKQLGVKPKASRSRAVKAPEINPGLSREEAYADAAAFASGYSVPLTAGGITVHDLGEILPDPNYHTRTHLFPVGFRSERLYASALNPNDRVVHTSEILQGDSGPVFRVCHEGGEPSWEGPSSSNVWQAVLNAVNQKRMEFGMSKGGDSISGPEMFGFANLNVAMVLEGLPGVLDCENYVFRAKRPGGKMATGPRRGRNSSGAGAAPSSPASAHASSNGVSPDGALLRSSNQELTSLQQGEIHGLKSILSQLQKLTVDHDVLVESGIGKMVNRLRKHSDKQVSLTAKDLREQWKATVYDNTASKKDLGVAVDCCIKISTYIGFGSEEPSDAVANKLAKKSKASTTPLQKLEKALDRVNQVKFVTTDILVKAGTGKPISKLCKHLSEEVKGLAATIKERWEHQIASPEEAVMFMASPKIAEGSEAQPREYTDTDGDVAMSGNGVGSEEGTGAVAKTPRQPAKARKKKEDIDDPNRRRSSRKRKEPERMSLAGPSNGGDLTGTGRGNKRARSDTVNTNNSESRAGSDGIVVADSHFPFLKKVDVSKIIEDLSMRPRVRIKIHGTVGLSFTHGDHDGTMWLETEEFRYRIGGVNVPVAPAANFVPFYIDAWKRFEASRRYVENLNAATESTTLDQILHLMVDGKESIKVPRRKGTELGAESVEHLTKQMVLSSVFCILDQLTRVHKKPKKTESALAHKATQVLVQRGVKAMSAEHRDFIRSEVLDSAKSAKQVEKEAYRQAYAQKRMIEEGIGLPDDLEVMETDKEHEDKGTEIENDFVRGIAEKQLATSRPLPFFLEFDPVFAEFESLIAFQRPKFEASDDKEPDFKDQKWGAFGPKAEGEEFSKAGVIFSEMFSTWSSLRFLIPLFDQRSFDWDLEVFANFRSRFAKGDVDGVFLALLRYLTEQEGVKKLAEVGTGTRVLAVEDSAGIATRRGKRSGANKAQTYTVVQPQTHVPTYPYNEDELWPVPYSVVNEISWPEVARRALVHQLQLEEEKLKLEEEEGDDDEDQQPITKRKRSALKKAVKMDPDLLSTCDEILADIMDDPASSPFSAPVDPVLHNVPNYFKIIKRPMDLETVQKRLRSGHYDTDRAPPKNRYDEIIEWNPDGDEEEEDEDEDGDGDDEEEGEEGKGKEKEKEGETPADGNTDEQIKAEPVASSATTETVKVEKDAASGTSAEAGVKKEENTAAAEVKEETASGEKSTPVKEEKGCATDGAPDAASSMEVDEQSANTSREPSGKTDATEVEAPKRIIRNQAEYQLALDERFFETDCLGAGHEGFAADMRQIWRNCKRFNKSHTKIYNDAKKLDSLFHRNYEAKVLQRDPRLLYDDDDDEEEIDSVKEEEPEEEEDSVKKAAPPGDSEQLNTLDFIGPYQKGLPSLEEVILELNDMEDFSKLHLGGKLRMVGSLVDMALDTPGVHRAVQNRCDKAYFALRDFAKQLREDQKRERDLISKGASAEEALAEHREAMKTALKEHDEKMQEMSIRLDSLGSDRYHNRYWVLDGASPYLYVEMARTGQWGIFSGVSEIEAFIESLDIRGVRENALRRALADRWQVLRERFDKEREEGETKLKMYAAIKNGEDPNRASEIERVQASLDAANVKLAELANDAALYKTAVSPEGKPYYFHKVTRVTSWAVPEAMALRDKQEQEVRSWEEALERAKAAPEEALERFKVELRNDAVLHMAVLHCKSESDQLSNEDICKEVEATLQEVGQEGYAIRIVNLLAGLLALEQYAAAPSASTSLVADPKEWDGPRKQWTADCEALVHRVDAVEPWETTLATLKDCFKRLYAVFNGNPYEASTDRAQFSNLSAIRHEYRWVRAVDRVQSLPALGLLYAQLLTILQFKEADLVALDRLRASLMNILKDGLSRYHHHK